MTTADIFRALAEESRIRIVYLLIKKELCVCEIEMILDMTQSNASRHLSKLKNAGIVSIRKESQWVYYRISKRFIEENSKLYEYLQEKMNTNNEHSADTDKLEMYINSGYTCERIKTDKNSIMESVSTDEKA
ncbi:MAG: ArsR/SmtB family transcription factor [Bacillota bacterium]